MRKNAAAVVTVCGVTMTLLLSSCTPDNQTNENPRIINTQSPPAAPMGPTSSAGTGAAESSSSAFPAAVDLYKHEFGTSWQEALQKARSQFDGDVAEIELDRFRGIYQYKVGLISDAKEFTIHVNADSGKATMQKTENLDQDEIKTKRREESINLDKIVDLRPAMDTARTVHNGPITEWKLEGGKAGPQYEFDIAKPGGGDYEVHVDARTGKAIEPGS